MASRPSPSMTVLSSVYSKRAARICSGDAEYKAVSIAPAHGASAEESEYSVCPSAGGVFSHREHLRYRDMKCVQKIFES